MSEMDRSSVANPSEDFKVRQIFVITQGVRYFKLHFWGIELTVGRFLKTCQAKTHFVIVDPVSQSLYSTALFI